MRRCQAKSCAYVLGVGGKQTTPRHRQLCWLPCIVALVICVAGSARSAHAQSDTTDAPRPRAHGLFVQPVGAIAMAAAGDLYVPLGLQWPLGAQSELVVEATLVSGNWYGCSSRSQGGWLAAGLASYLSHKTSGSRGWFVEPKLIGRYFDTHGAHGASGWFGCSATEAGNLNQTDFELHLGVDAGYEIRVGALEIIPLLGVSAGFCSQCVGGSPFFVGSLAPLSGPGLRSDRPTLGLNLNLLRLGLRF